MTKKMFYLIMTAGSFLFSIAASLALVCVMDCTKTNAIIVLCVSMFGTLLTLAWWDSFTKCKS